MAFQVEDIDPALRGSRGAVGAGQVRNLISDPPGLTLRVSPDPSAAVGIEYVAGPTALRLGWGRALMGNRHGLQVLVSVLAAVLVLTWLARRMRVVPPVVLLLGGVLLAFLPWMGGVLLSPGVVLLLFLPALLFPEALSTSLREILANLRMVLLSSILLVLATAAAVAMVGRALGLSWPVAWVLGAVVAPTDATALATVADQMPRRMLTSLRAESVINDGAALVLFAVAVAVVTGAQAVSWGNALGSFTISYLGGTVVGLVVAGLAFWARRSSHERLPENGGWMC